MMSDDEDVCTLHSLFAGASTRTTDSLNGSAVSDLRDCGSCGSSHSSLSSSSSRASSNGETDKNSLELFLERELDETKAELARMRMEMKRMRKGEFCAPTASFESEDNAGAVQILERELNETKERLAMTRVEMQRLSRQLSGHSSKENCLDLFFETELNTTMAELARTRTELRRIHKNEVERAKTGERSETQQGSSTIFQSNFENYKENERLEDENTNLVKEMRLLRERLALVMEERDDLEAQLGGRLGTTIDIHHGFIAPSDGSTKQSLYYQVRRKLHHKSIQCLDLEIQLQKVSEERNEWKSVAKKLKQYINSMKEKEIADELDHFRKKYAEGKVGSKGTVLQQESSRTAASMCTTRCPSWKTPRLLPGEEPESQQSDKRGFFSSQKEKDRSSHVETANNVSHLRLIPAKTKVIKNISMKFRKKDGTNSHQQGRQRRLVKNKKNAVPQEIQCFFGDDNGSSCSDITLKLPSCVLTKNGDSGRQRQVETSRMARSSDKSEGKIGRGSSGLLQERGKKAEHRAPVKQSVGGTSSLRPDRTQLDTFTGVLLGSMVGEEKIIPFEDRTERERNALQLESLRTDFDRRIENDRLDLRLVSIQPKGNLSPFEGGPYKVGNASAVVQQKVIQQPLAVEVSLPAGKRAVPSSASETVPPEQMVTTGRAA